MYFIFHGAFNSVQVGYSVCVWWALINSRPSSHEPCYTALHKTYPWCIVLVYLRNSMRNTEWKLTCVWFERENLNLIIMTNPNLTQHLAVHSELLHVMDITQTTEVSIYGTFTHVRAYAAFSVESFGLCKSHLCHWKPLKRARPQWVMSFPCAWWTEA